MLNHVIAFSLKNRPLVLVAAVVLMMFGGYQAVQLPIDVFPDLNRPTVTILTEAPGLAPEEVETLVTYPIESVMNGATNVRRVRSASGVGLSVVWVEFDWETNIFTDRQIVSEKLQTVRSRLPRESTTIMTPISSIMGEIMLVGVQATGETTPIDLRTLADWTIRPRLLSLGLAQVIVMGGEQKQYQVLTSPERLAEYNVTLDELTRAIEKSNIVTGGGFLMGRSQEALIRIVGRAATLESLENTVVRHGHPAPITVRQVAEVRFGGPVKRGDGGVNGKPSVILSIHKQPGADTLKLDQAIRDTLAEIQQTLPSDVKIDTEVFRQANFIRTAIGNVEEAVRDGALWVIVVLFLFLWNFRTSIITLTAIPLSVLITALLFHYFGVSINTMTLGGLAVAIGELVDDSIVDVENIYRRLKENRHKSKPDNPLKVIFLASAEIRNSVVYATLIVVCVVCPLFALGGLEGRMFAPLGLSYLVTLLMSLVVSLTVTPVLTSYLLPQAKMLEHAHDPVLIRWMKWVDEKLLHWTLRHAYWVLGVTSVMVAISVGCLTQMGGDFMPPFQEGSLTIGATAPTAINLAEANRLGALIENTLLDVQGVVSVSRRTGRAELDEHAENVNYSELDVVLVPFETPRPGFLYAALRAVPGLHRWGVDHFDRSRDEVMAEIRDRLSEFPGVSFNIGQPISHRLDHIMSGIRSQIAVKVFGPNLDVLRAQVVRVERLMKDVPGVVDLQVEPQVEVPQLRVTVKREEAARYGLAPADVAQALETSLQGRTISQVLEGHRTFDLVLWFTEKARNDIDTIRSTLISTPTGARVSLDSVAEVVNTTGPNTINRESASRRIVVQANVSGRDLVGVVDDIQRAVSKEIIPTLPPGYYIRYDGQFEAQQEADVRLKVLGTLALGVVMLLLYKCLGTWQAALQVMVNIPLAAIGSVIALLLTHWPSAAALAAAAWWEWPLVWVRGCSLSIAHWVGFITLAGIVSRNGIMMISHYIHLMQHEGEKFDEKMIIRGSLERLAPVWMTALATGIGLIPLVLGAGQTGKEILHPLAVVVVGGLISSTLLDQIVTPALFWKFGQKIYEHPPAEDAAHKALETDLHQLAAQFE
ncbi:MAG: efflux RND transporter permease subunit [Planctomycetes bacterium]|nr:efflux RND transporter permease subunit [Planctomycetota bacterium]